MRLNFPKNLISLAENMPCSLFAVGGVVRNAIIDSKIVTEDIDLCAPIKIEDFIPLLKEQGFSVVAEYNRSGTIVFTDGVYRYEFASFRTESYVGGEHTPVAVEFTDDICKDALRRDFKCNAVYYDILRQEIVDVLGGVEDIKNKVLSTVCNPEHVFKNDGLRLMRLARFAGELNFKPTKQTIDGAKLYANNIKDISGERIYDELIKILNSDEKYPFSDPMGHYTGLKILDETRVLDRILPELTDGRGMAQRSDFHKYDVLEHSLRSVAYADKSIRLPALMHDIGKPYCFRRDGWYHWHYVEGQTIAERALKRLKASNEVIEQVKYLIREHMVDLDCSMNEKDVRIFLVKNRNELDSLIKVKQTDYRASLESYDTAPTLVKWGEIYEKMQQDGTPFTLKDLSVTTSDLMKIGYKGKALGTKMNDLFITAVRNPEYNSREFLLEKARKDFKEN